MKNTFYLLLFLCLLFFEKDVVAQDLPFTLNTAGAYGKINNQLYDFSIGEMVLVQTFQAVMQVTFIFGYGIPIR